MALPGLSHVFVSGIHLSHRRVWKGTSFEALLANADSMCPASSLGAADVQVVGVTGQQFRSR